MRHAIPVERREWVLLAGALAYACWGCWSALDEFAASSLPAHRPPAEAARAPSGAEAELRWESDNGFSRFYAARGAGRANEGLAAFRDGLNASDYRSRESSLAALARSLDPAVVRAKLAEAERAGAPPEVIAHYRYLKEIVDAFLEGRLHELVARARDGREPENN